MFSNAFFFNPFIIYCICWTCVLLTYLLGWSDLYPVLSFRLLSFFFITILISFIIGQHLSKKHVYIFFNTSFSLKKIKRWIRAYIFFNVIEILYSRQIPILSIIGLASPDSADYYGVPIFHPFIVTFGIFLSLYIFQKLIICNGPEKKQLLKYYLLSFLSTFIIFGRGLLLLTILGCLILYIIIRGLNSKVFFLLLCAILIIFFAFGVAGNIRIGEAGVRITTIGQATDKFEKNIVPDEFFWSYIYASSPLANLEYNIDSYSIKDVTIGDLYNMCLSEIVPEAISNNISCLKYNNDNVQLIIPALNVCTVYAGSYSIAGWTGIWIMYLYIVVFNLFIIKIIPRKSEYYTTAIAILNILMLGNVFDNMMNYLLSYTIIFPLIFSIKIRIFNHGRNRHIDGDIQRKQVC